MISIYADGSSTGRADQPGGWGFVIARDGRPLLCGYGGDPKTTNNRQELMGAIKGLEAALRLDLVDSIELVSDSQYTLGMASGAYMIHEGRNEDLIFPLRKLMKHLGATTRWVRGHIGDPLNERVDRLAKRGKREATCPTKT